MKLKNGMEHFHSLLQQHFSTSHKMHSIISAEYYENKKQTCHSNAGKQYHVEWNGQPSVVVSRLAWPQSHLIDQ